MEPQVVTLFFAMLAVASLAVVAGAAGLAVAARTSPAAAAARSRIRADLSDQATGLAAGVTTVAAVGSLYLSEVAHFRPCLLCWVQRGFMYPLAAVLLVAAVGGWHGVRPWARVWALLGAGVASWHVAVERFPALEGAAACDVANPCSLRWVEHLGFVTIPVMAAAAFLLSAVLLSVPASRGSPVHVEPVEVDR